MSETTRDVCLSRTVDCGQVKYTVSVDRLGVSVYEGDICLAFVDVPAFHAAVIADAIVTLTAEYAADMAKLRGGKA